MPHKRRRSPRTGESTPNLASHSGRPLKRTSTPDRDYPGKPLPKALLDYEAKADLLAGPKWQGKAAGHVSHRNRGQLAKTPVIDAQTVTRWEQNPRQSNPQRITRAAQKALRARRIDFIVDLMSRDLWEPSWTKVLGDKWVAHAKPDSRLAYIWQLAAVAHNIVSRSFNRDDIARKMLVRQETAARDCMRVGTLPAYRTMVRIHEHTAKIVGIGRDTPVQSSPHVTQTVQIMTHADGSTRVRAGAMKALFRGRESTPTLPPSEGTQVEG